MILGQVMLDLNRYRLLRIQHLADGQKRAAEQDAYQIDFLLDRINQNFNVPGIAPRETKGDDQ